MIASVWENPWAFLMDIFRNFFWSLIYTTHKCVYYIYIYWAWYIFCKLNTSREFFTSCTLPCLMVLETLALFACKAEQPKCIPEYLLWNWVFPKLIPTPTFSNYFSAYHLSLLWALGYSQLNIGIIIDSLTDSHLFCSHWIVFGEHVLLII